MVAVPDDDDALLTNRQSYCRVYGTLHHLSALFQYAVCITRVT